MLDGQTIIQVLENLANHNEKMVIQLLSQIQNAEELESKQSRKACTKLISIITQAIRGNLSRKLVERLCQIRLTFTRENLEKWALFSSTLKDFLAFLYYKKGAEVERDFSKLGMWLRNIQLTSQSLQKGLEALPSNRLGLSVVYHRILLFYRYCQILETREEYEKAKSILKALIEESQAYASSHNRFKSIAVNMQLDYSKVLVLLKETTTAIEYLDALIEEAQRMKSRELEAGALLNMGDAFLVLNRYQRAMSFFRRSLEISEDVGNRQLQAQCLGNIASIYADQGKYGTAEEYNARSIAIFREINDQFSELLAEEISGRLSEHEGNINVSIDHFKNALRLARNFGNSEREATHLGQIGRSYVRLLKPYSALQYLMEALKIREKTKDIEGQMICYGNIAAAYGHLNRSDLEIEYRARCAKGMKRLGDSLNAGREFIALGDCLYEQKRTYEAKRCYLEALSELKKSSSPLSGLHQAKALACLARTSQKIKKTDVAISEMEKSKEVLEMSRSFHYLQTTPKFKFEFELVDCIASLAEAMHELGQEKESAKYFTQAKNLAEKLDARIDILRCLSGLGSVYYSLGKMQESEANFQKAITLIEQWGADIGSAASFYFRLADVTSISGMLPKAVEFSEKAIESARKTGDHEFVVAASLLASEMCRKIGYFEQAVEFLRPLISSNKTKDAGEEVDLLVAIAKCLLQIGEHNIALRYAMRAYRKAERPDMFYQKADSMFLIGRALMAQHLFRKSIHALEKALILFEKERKIYPIWSAVNSGAILKSLGNSYCEIQEKSKALECYLRALAIFRSTNYRIGIAGVLSDIGELHLKQGDFEESVRYLNKSVKLHREIGLTLGLVRSLQLRGRAVLGLENPRRAFRNYKDALKIMQQDLLGRISIGEWRRSFRDALMPLYEDIVVASHALGDHSRTFDYIDSQKSCELLHVLLTPNLERGLPKEYYKTIAKQKGYVSELVSSIGKLDEGKINRKIKRIRRIIDYTKAHLLLENVRFLPRDESSGQSHLTEEAKMRLSPFGNWAIIEYFVHAESIMIYLLTGDYAKVVEVPRKQAPRYILSLNELISNSLMPSSSIDYDEKFVELGLQVYRYLFPPSIQEIIDARKPETLIIIPHKELNEVPWECLHDGEGFLGLELSVCRNFSTQILLHQLFPKKTTTIRRSILIGNPTEDLQATERETDELNEILSAAGTTCIPLIGNNATIENLKNALTKETNILHFTGHGEYFYDLPELSSLVLHSNAERVNKREYLTADEIAVMGFSGCRLAFLNACVTGKRRHVGGNEFKGLVTAFMENNVASVIGTSNLVRSGPSKQLATEFYSQLIHGENIGEALKIARNRVSENSGKVADWAPYVLYGNPFSCLYHDQKASVG